MDVIILADRLGGELLPLTDNTCVALLPVAGKPLIEHSLEALVTAGLAKVHIVLSAHAAPLKDYCADGARWGLQISYSTSRGDVLPRQILARLPNPPSLPFLLLRGDILRSNYLADFLKHAKPMTAPCVQALFSKENAYMMLCHQADAAAIDNLAWSTPQLIDAATVHLDGQVNTLASLAQFHQANLAAIAGRFTGLRITGRQSSEGLKQGRRSKISAQNLKHGAAWVGSFCDIHPSVELGGDVLIGDNVIIDRCATLEACVILPYSYIGELVELRQAIVRGNDLIRIDNGAILKISDACLLTDLRIKPLRQHCINGLNRLAGWLLLLLSAPLWLLELVCALPKTPQWFCKQSLRGNKVIINECGMPERVIFTGWQWQVNAPVLRYLPRLLAVTAGHLHLVGTAAVSQELAAQRSGAWQQLADTAPAGLFSFSQLNLAANAPVEEQVLSDAYYCAGRGIKQDIACLWQAFTTLASRKAWVA